MARQVPGYCTLCRSRCGTLNTIEDGRLVAVAPLQGHPTGRAICAKGRAAPEIAHSSRRLTQPLRRTRPKESEDPGWAPVGWDEALDEIAARLEAIRAAHGPEAVGFAVTSPSATPIVDSVEWIERFVHLFGSPNFCTATEICNWQKDVAHAFTFGEPLPLPDYGRTDLVILWGHNPSSVWLAEAGELAEAVARGARLAVVDPRRTGHVHHAAHWLRVRPGTDAALALGLAHLLIASGRIDRAFLRDWTNGPLLVREDEGRLLRMGDHSGDPADGRFVVFDEAAGRAVPFDPGQEPGAGAFPALEGRFEVAGIACRTAFDRYAERATLWPSDRVETVTGVPAASVEALAEAIGDAKAVSWYAWTGVGQHAGSTQTARAIATLHALTGSFDAPGGNLVPARLPIAPIADRSLLAEPQRAKALGAADRPIGPAALGMVTARELYDAILDGRPYRVRGLVTFGANLLLTRPDVESGRRALAALDLSVHCDLFETPTARDADFLLPVGSPWEREALKIGFDITEAARGWVQLRPAMIPRVGESRSDAEIVCALARRLGFADRMFGGDIEAGWRHQLEPSGLTLDDLRRAPEGLPLAVESRPRGYARVEGGRVAGFRTETGRVELHSELLRRHGQDPLPDYVPPEPAGSALPFLLTCAKSAYYCQSQHRQVASLRRRAPEPVVVLAEDVAAARGIRPGAAVEIVTRAGRARFRAAIDAAMAPGVAAAEFGWWRETPDLGLPGYDPFADGGSNYNRLVDSGAVDPVSGAPALKSMPCDVRPVAGRAPTAWDGVAQMVVRARREQAGGVVELVLAREDGGGLPGFRPGQHVGLALDIPGTGRVERSYSLCGPCGQEGAETYRIAIRPIVDGVGPGLVSTRCAATIRPGDRVGLRAPSGTFVLPLRADFPVVLVAAGIGITPFLGYLHALSAGPAAGPEVTLHYGSRDGAHHAFRQEIAALAALLPRLRIVDHYSRPTAEDLASHTFDRRGRISADDIDPDLVARRARFYLCGPGDMIEAVRSGLVARGVPRFEIFSEVFRSPARTEPASETGSARYRVTFARSGRTVDWTAAEGDLLTLAERHGLSLPSGCRVAQCESCAVPVLSGRVEHLLPVAELDGDLCLTCRAIPASDLVLDA